MIRFQKTLRKNAKKIRWASSRVDLFEILKDCADKYGFPICGFDIELKKYANGFEINKQTDDI